MLTKYGTDNIVIMLIIGVVLLGVGHFLPRNWISYLVGALGVILILFTLWFFRDPDRSLPPEAKNDNSLIIAPADGKVVLIKEIDEQKYLHQKAMQISIFLSPLDVHVNRNPVSGRVEYYKYTPGDYLVAYHPKASELNEHSSIGVMTAHGKVLYKQITGILARRIVCTLKEGDSVSVGDRFGMMKFGSRMDIIFDPSTEIKVKVGDRVTAGETIIARLK